MKKRSQKLMLAKETLFTMERRERVAGGLTSSCFICSTGCTYQDGYGCTAYCPTTPMTTLAQTCVD